MNPRAISFFLLAAFFAAAAIAIRLLPMGVVSDATYDAGAATATATGANASGPDTLPMPEFVSGESVADVGASFPPVTAARRVTAPSGSGREAWEWSEPAGRYALAEFEGGRLVTGFVRRPENVWLPAVEADRLPQLRAGMSLAEVEAIAGTGWPIERTVMLDGMAPVETRAWAIRDRGVGTGAVLRVAFRDGRALVILHPWARL